jgi:hypothetical protein
VQTGHVTNQVALITILVVLAVVVWFDWLGLADLASARYVRYLSRGAWAVVIVSTFPLGGVLYLTYGRVR